VLKVPRRAAKKFEMIDYGKIGETEMFLSFTYVKWK
jgi:hypothetical protein